MARPARPFVAHPRHPITGRQFRVSARTDRELAAALHDVDTLRLDYTNGRRSALDVERAIRRMLHGQVTLERIATSYRAGASKNTARRVRSFLSAAAAPLASLDVYELDGPRVAAWIGDLRAGGYEESTIGTAWRTLSALARHAAERGWIAGAPWGAYRPARVRDRSPASLRESARTLDELGALFGGALALDRERGPRSFVHAKCVAIALLGVRQGELAGLRWPDVDPARQTVRIERQYDGQPLKHRRPCELAAAPLLFQVFAEHASRLARAKLFVVDGPVFPSIRVSTDGSPRPYTSGECLAISDLRAAVRLSSLPRPERWAPTSLRDSFATLEQLGAQGDLRRLAERTRHASLASLARYLRTRVRQPAPPGFSPELAPAAAVPLLLRKKQSRR